jgi:hypothetical protein
MERLEFRLKLLKNHCMAGTVYGHRGLKYSYRTRFEIQGSIFMIREPRSEESNILWPSSSDPRIQRVTGEFLDIDEMKVRRTS